MVQPAEADTHILIFPTSANSDGLILAVGTDKFLFELSLENRTLPAYLAFRYSEFFGAQNIRFRSAITPHFRFGYGS